MRVCRLGMEWWSPDLLDLALTGLGTCPRAQARQPDEPQGPCMNPVPDFLGAHDCSNVNHRRFMPSKQAALGPARTGHVPHVLGLVTMPCSL